VASGAVANLFTGAPAFGRRINFRQARSGNALIDLPTLLAIDQFHLHGPFDLLPTLPFGDKKPRSDLLSSNIKDQLGATPTLLHKQPCRHRKSPTANTV
jgi:hypothetical protein